MKKRISFLSKKYILKALEEVAGGRYCYKLKLLMPPWRGCREWK